MITALSATDYGCLRNVDATFSRLHALIGPNDSGKSSILRALRTVSQLVASEFGEKDDRWTPFDPGLAHDSPLPRTTTLAATCSAGRYSIELHDILFPGGKSGRSSVEETVSSGHETETRERDLRAPSRLLRHVVNVNDWKFGIAHELGNVHYLALSEEGLRSPSGFMPRHHAFLSTHGEGLPGLYFALRNDREEAFERILEGTRSLFPTVKTVRAQPRSTTELELEVELLDGARVRAPHISTGLLYYLAFAALPEVFGHGATVLLEEPENGLHPARIRQVMSVLRTLAESHDTQIIMATHSPLVVNELMPEEVTVVTRPSVEAGTTLTPIAETPNFEKRASVYALGELWLSYADGRLEGPLFDPAAR
ncbi:MAG: ATP-binding protein [Labilithrix sp.]|nr:ATP-binding protein [Labilithrix sp.]